MQSASQIQNLLCILSTYFLLILMIKANKRVEEECSALLPLTYFTHILKPCKEELQFLKTAVRYGSLLVCHGLKFWNRASWCFQ